MIKLKNHWTRHALFTCTSVLFRRITETCRYFEVSKVFSNFFSHLTGLGTICDATQSVSCYGILGEPVYLQLIRTTRKYDLLFRRNNTVILRYANSRINFYQGLEKFQYVSANGTLIIKSLEFADSSIYTIEIFETNGTKMATNNMLLIVHVNGKMITMSLPRAKYVIDFEMFNRCSFDMTALFVC